jgi:mRNA-degrading endonuclease RelE of RelBE toxin-antitoxin system
MNNIDFSRSYSKELLRNLSRMKQTKFKEWMRTIEPELIKIDSTYSKYGSLLTPKAFKFLLSEMGLEDPDEINNMIREYYKGTGINKD